MISLVCSCTIQWSQDVGPEGRFAYLGQAQDCSVYQNFCSDLLYMIAQLLDPSLRFNINRCSPKAGRPSECNSSPHDAGFCCVT